MHSVRKVSGKYQVYHPSQSDKDDDEPLIECPDFYTALRLCGALNGSVERMQPDDFIALFRNCTEIFSAEPPTELKVPSR